MLSCLRALPFRHRSLRRDERGAIALEMGIVFMFLFTFLAGIIDVSAFFKDAYSISTSARAGARIAAADPMSTSFARDAAFQVSSAMEDIDYTRVQEVYVYKANPSTGEPVGVCPGTACVKFTFSSTGTPSAGTGTWLARNACIPTSSSSPDVDTVGVKVRYRHKAIIQFLNNQDITQTAAMRLEQIPSTQPCLSIL